MRKPTETNVNLFQHMTMFAFFLFHCFFELAYYYEVEAIPPYLDYLTVALAFLVEGILFLWHLHGRSMMDVQASCIFRINAL